MSGNNFSFSNDLGSSLFGQSPLDASLSDESGLQALMDALNKSNSGSKGAILDSSQMPSAYTAPYSPLQSAQTGFSGSGGGSGSSGKTNKAAAGDRDSLTGLSNSAPIVSPGAFTLRTEGSLNMNGSGDLDGDPLNLQDDALVYAAKGFTINGNATLPVMRDAKGNPLRDANGKLILVDNALTVAAGYTSSKGPDKSYAGINPPKVISAQSVELPSYTGLVNQTLTSRNATGQSEVIFNAQTSLNSLSDWNSRFPKGGTATRPTVVRVINGNLNIPNGANLSNTVITVENGNLNFNGNCQTFTNVVLITQKGSINLSNVKGTNLAVFAAGAINTNGSAQFAGASVLATSGTTGNITFNGSTQTIQASDQLQVIAGGNITYNGASNTRAFFTSAGTFTFNGSSTLYGSIAAKGNILFNGSAKIVGVSNNTNQAPTDLNLTPSSVFENVPGYSTVGTLSTTDPNSSDTHTYSLMAGSGDGDNASFAIVGNQLQIKTAADFETKSTYSIRVRTTDAGGLVTDKVLTVSVLDLNEAPIALQLSGNTVDENNPADALIGRFSSIDPDANNTFTYELVTGLDSTDNAAFTLVGNELRIKDSTDCESKSSYAVRVRTTDQGGLSYEQSYLIQVNNLNEAPSFTSQPLDKAAVGKLYSYAVTTTDPEGDQRSITAQNLPAWLSFTDQGNGTGMLSGKPQLADLGLHTVQLTVTDAKGLQNTQNVFISVGALILEERYFNPELSTTITIPNQPSVLKFKIEPSFDSSDRDSIRDAFEVDFVDGTGKSLVHTIATGSRSFFNFTEGLAPTTATGVSFDPVTQIVSLNLMGVAPGTTGKLVFHLVNNDSDTTSQVGLETIQIVNAPAGTQIPQQSGGTSTSQSDPLNATLFGQMQDVSPSLKLQYGSTTFNDQTNLLYADVTLKNIGSYAVNVPLVVAVKNISDPTVSLRDPDGFTPEGLPYYNFSHLVSDQNLNQGEATLAQKLVFFNPNEVQFTYDIVALSVLNQAPVIHTSPTTEILAGQSYRYDVKATDANRDPLTYTLLSAPDGMTINAQTGSITWQTGTANVGSHAVKVQVSDGRGGVDQQSFLLEVETAVPNRPPIFTSTPEVDANVNTPYRYDANATDLDQDSLTFTLINGPQGMTIDAASGLVQWTPTASQLGDFDVLLNVSDSKGGIAKQNFKIQTRTLVGNNPPIISTEANTQANLGRAYTYDVDAVDPDNDHLIYSLLNSPAGMSIDSNTGKITWMPSIVGQQAVTVLVTDSRGGKDTQEFSLNVSSTGLSQIKGKVYSNDFLIDGTGLPVTAILTADNHYGLYYGKADGSGLTLVGRNEFGGGGSVGAYNWNYPETFNFKLQPDDYLYVLSWNDGGPRMWMGEFDLPNGLSLLSDTTAWKSQIASGNNPYYLGGALPPTTEITEEINRGSWTTPLASAQNIGYSGTVWGLIPGISSSANFIWHDSFYAASSSDSHYVIYKTVEPLGQYSAEQNNSGLEGQIVYLDFNQNHQRDTNETYTVTDTQGNYSFSVQPGVYTVAQETQSGWIQAGSAPKTYQFSLIENQTVTSINFVNAQGTPHSSGENASPVITSQPVTTVEVGQKLLYRSAAVDPDGDSLIYDLAMKPSGMVVDARTGFVGWRPTPTNVGTHDVILRVQDKFGGVDLQSFQVTVLPANAPPVFTTAAPSESTYPVVGRPFQYQFKAQDAEGEHITYELDAGDEQATINSETGLLTWTPRTSFYPWIDTGKFPFVVYAKDSHGGRTPLSFSLSVVDSVPVGANAAPVITSTPRTQTRPGNLYLYQVNGTDSQGDRLTYSLQTSPTGMTIQDGLIRWQPTAQQSGDHTVVVQVSDGELVTTQTFNLRVANQTTNLAPTITSAPNGTTNLERLYSYDLSGSDPDGDLIRWSLDAAPAGMVIDPQTGALRWQPNPDQIGQQRVVVRLTDTLGAYSVQEFTLKVTGSNLPPAIASVPITQAALNQPYVYSIVASDPENDTLRYSLGRRPAGMAIDSTGRITWTPNQLGSFDVDVTVTDSQGGAITQTYRIEVSATAINRAPSITSTPNFVATLGSAYRYQVQASDPEGQALTYQLLEAPSGMSINATTGLLEWTTPIAGNYRVVVSAIDAQGLAVAQGFTLSARANGLPVIRSSPLLSTTLGQIYRYDLQASDPEGGALTYALDADSRNKGMKLDVLGRLRWTPTASQIGSHTLTLTVTDDAGATTSQSFNLSVTADTTAPQIRLIGSTNLAEKGETVWFQVLASDNVGVANLRLLINNTAVAIDGNGVAEYTATAAGILTAQAIAVDAAGNQSETSTSIQIRDRSDINAPVISLDLPDDAEFTSPTNIIGTVNDSNLLYYSLEVAPLSGGEFREIFRGTTATTNGVLGQFDPTQLQNDAYILRLTAEDAGGNVTSIERTINVTGDLKLGNFRLSFTDLTIPVTGIPITLTRTYDTLTSNTTDDFGYGWRLEFRDTDLRTSLGRDRNYEELGIRTLGFKQGTKVYITLPGGQRESFTFKPTVNPLSIYLATAAVGYSGDPNLYNPAFTAEKGTTSTLSVRDANGANSTLVRGADGTFVNLAGQKYNPGDSYFGGIYVLTTKEGVVYEIDGLTGDLLTVTDTNGNTLTYTDSAITSSSGQQVTFGRDAQGRITSVTDPSGNQVKYEYDALGDLVAVSDREGNTTRYDYSDSGSHYLEQIIDPLGRTGARNDYDATGRLKRIVDANGNAVEMIYDPNNSIQKVKDALGNETVYEYDQRGNVVTEIDAEGKITRRTYDTNNWVLSETMITAESGSQGWTTTYTYNAQGNQLTQTNALGQTDYYSYDAKGHLLSRTDALGNTTRYTYDSRGNLLTKTDATGHTITTEYDARGNLRRKIEGTDDITIYDYDNWGNKIKETDALGNVTTFEYDRNGNLTKEIKTLTTATGVRTLTTKRTYTDDGDLKTSIDAEGGLTQYEYDANGNQTLIIDPLGRRTLMRYDSKNQLTETVYPDATPADLSDNPRRRYGYDANGNKISLTDLDDDVTTYSYNSQKLPTGMIGADSTPNNLLDNSRVEVTYTQAGWLKTLIQNGVRTEFEHDALGQIILTRVIKDGQGLETLSTYDAVGQKISETDPLGRVTRYEYDAVGRLTRTTYADGTSSSTLYNSAGKAIAQTDALGRTTQHEYDALDRLTAVIDATNQRIEYRYDEMGNLVAQTDANGRVTRYEYDGLGRKTAMIRPMGERSAVEYDQGGRAVKTTDFNGEVITYNYDVQNRLVSKTLQQEGITTRFTYTADGHQETVIDSRGTTHFQYNPLGQLLTRIEPDGTKLLYTYDPLTQKVRTVTSPSGTTTYDYNSLAQLAKVTAPDGGVTTYSYDANGNLIGSVRPNGTVLTYRYDALNRLTYLENKTQAGEILSSYAYIYDAVGNKLSVTEFGGRTINFTYDQLNRLVKEVISNPGFSAQTIEYTYDAVGNRLGKTGSVTGLTTYSYDENDQLVTETTNGVTTTYSYDRNGNLITEQSVSKTVTYEWDSENRLLGTTTVDATGTQRVQYQYDASGTRVATITNGQETRYLVDSNRQYAQVIEEYTPAGITTASYVYGDTLLSQRRNGSTSFYLFDGHSGVRQLTNAAGAVTDTYLYDGYGNLLQRNGSTVNPYLYRGEQTDSNSGLQYLRARYYDQQSGRFLSTDPFEGWQEQPMSRHRYLYGNNNPITYIDPSGRVATMGETSITFAILNTLQQLFFLQQGASLLIGDLGSPLPKIVWDGDLSINVIDSKAAKLSLNTGTPLDNLKYFEPLFLYGVAEATSSTGKSYAHNVWAFGAGLQISLSNPEDKVFQRVLDFEVVTDRIYGDGPNSLRGFFNLTDGTLPASLSTIDTLGFIKFGHAAGYASRSELTTATSIVGGGSYFGYSGRGV